VIDWQSYLDGSMPDAERQSIEQRIEADEALQRELEGHQAFASSIQEAGQAEAVPYNKLHAMMDAVIKPAAPTVKVAFLRPALLMAVILAVFALGARLTSDPHALARTPLKGHIRAISPEQAAHWAIEKTGLPAPLVPLEGTGADLIGASHGANWASYQYRVGEDRVTLTFANRKSVGMQKNKLGQISANGVSWQGKKLAFYLSGPRAALLKVMHKAMEETRVPYEPDPSACRIVE